MPSRVLVLLIVLLLPMALGSCGGDDDTDDSATPHHDNIDDDDDGLDVDDDNSDDDAGDDDAGDNDAGDDDTVDDDNAADPLAILECDATCMEPGDTITVSGAASTDPGGLSLAYTLDWGDGTVTHAAEDEHAYEQDGAYRVTLTVTNSAGKSDRTSCVVSAGAPESGPGPIDVVDFQPNVYDERIIERSAPPLHGGTLDAFFNAPFDATVTEIRVNGVRWDNAASPVEWCEVSPPVLTTGEIAVLRCLSRDASMEVGSIVSLDVLTNAGRAWSYLGPIEETPVSMGYVVERADESELLIHLRNSEDDETMFITGVAVNGVDVTPFMTMDEPVLTAHRSGVMRVKTCDGIDWGRRAVVQAFFNDGKSESSVTRELRLFPPRFAVGNWNSSDVFTDPDWRQVERDAGIDLFIWSPSPSAPPGTILPLAEDEDFYVFTHVGTPNADYIDAAQNWGGNPRWLMNAVAGEPDIGGDPPATTLAKVQAQLALLGEQLPQWIYLACSNRFSEWGAMGDIGGMDHYCVWAPKCNYNSPPFYWDAIEFAGYYTQVAKQAAEPRPIVNWTQGIDNVMEIGGTQLRCNTPDEIRSQWYQNLGYGSKTLLWFLFRKDIDDACPEAPEQEMGRLRDEADQFSNLVLTGDVADPEGFARSDDAQIDIATTVSPDGLLLVVTNLDYDLNLLLPYAWHEKTNVEIVVDPPDGFEPASAWTPDGSDRVDLPLRREGALWVVTIPSLPVARAVIIEPEP